LRFFLILSLFLSGAISKLARLAANIEQILLNNINTKQIISIVMTTYIKPTDFVIQYFFHLFTEINLLNQV